MTVYNPVDCAEKLVTDALNTGRQIQGHEKDLNFVQKQCQQFARQYGLLGWMIFLPQNPDFNAEDQVYLGERGKLIGSRVMSREDYTTYFYPMGRKISHPAAFTMGREDAYDLVFDPCYGEPMNWLAACLINLYTHFFCVVNWNKDGFTPDENTVMKYQAAAFENNGIRFHLSGSEHPQLVWETDSLSTTIEMFYALAITDPAKPLKMCKFCGSAYYNPNSRSEFCSVTCRNHYNVNAFRRRKKEEQGEG